MRNLRDGAHLDTGRIGEALARDHLQSKGYKCREQNWRTRFGEIDIVAETKEFLVCVEVRTKIGEQYGSPEDTLDHKKMRRLSRNANAYATINHIRKPCRVDAVCVVLNSNREPVRIDHYENVTA